MVDTRATRGSEQFHIRLPDGLRDRIRLAAEQAGRSMNAEIINTLSEAYPAPPEEGPDLSAMMDSLQAATSPDDFAARARVVNAQLQSAGYPFRIDMVPSYPGKISFSAKPRLPVPPEGETVILSGRSIKKD